jgi:hypothetical protein
MLLFGGEINSIARLTLGIIRRAGLPGCRHFYISPANAISTGVSRENMKEV